MTRHSRRARRATSITLATGVVAAAALGATPSLAGAAELQPELGHRDVNLLNVDGLQFKDLNRNGSLDPYEDWRLDSDQRADDLVSQMTLEEKAGTMLHPIAFNSSTGYYFEDDEVPAGVPPFFKPLRSNIVSNHVTSLLTAFASDPATLVEQHNTIQEIAEGTGLGIPVSLSSDPRNGFSSVNGQSSAAGSFTKWPGTLGFAAIGDADLVQEFADDSRQEYLASGLSIALSPQADISTEPRWSRINGTFGEDPDTVTAMTEAYTIGFQGGATGLDESSVVAVVKHFAGYGAQVDGFDSHNEYGQYATFENDTTGQDWANTLKPFEAAFSAGAASVMPTYSILQGPTVNGQQIEQVGAGFSSEILQDELRGVLGFDGVIVTDWQITDDVANNGKPWGVQDLTEEQRFAKAINAGVDQFGGTSNGDQIVAAVEDGLVTEERLDESVHRILVQKFDQGLFENPYSDVETAEATLGNDEFLAASLDAQHRSVTLLQNDQDLLPLAGGLKVYAYGLDADALADHDLSVVDDPADADVAILRIATPSSGEHGTDLGYKDDNVDYQALQAVAATGVPTVVAVGLDRPAILTNIIDKADAVVAHYGISDQALLDDLTGVAEPEGRLPFQLPRDSASVEAQSSSTSFDLSDPLYDYGFGLSYAGSEDPAGPEPSATAPGQTASGEGKGGALAATGAELPLGAGLLALVLAAGGAILSLSARRPARR